MWAGLVSALAVSARHLYIKKFCPDIPAEALILATRFFGALSLTPLALTRGLVVRNGVALAGVTTLTVVLTAAATIIQIRVIQRDALSRSVPYLSLIPLFMIPWTILLLREAPSRGALLGLLLACSGAWMLNSENRTSAITGLKGILGARSSRLMLLSALGLGATTTCDKLAIEASSAFSYTYIWTAASVAMMAACCHRLDPAVVRRVVLTPHVFVQAAIWAVGFFAQMYGVQLAAAVPSGVTYVKMLTMANVLLTVGAGGRMFGEDQLTRSLAAALLMTGGSVLTVLSAR